MNLKSVNSDLIQQVAILEEELRNAKQEVAVLSKQISPAEMRHLENAYPKMYSFLPAQVVNNQTGKMNNNYITLNRGSLFGVKEDMGVLSPTGIVGVVRNVSPHFSRVIPILNPKYHPNCKIKGTNFFGPLSWDGKDPQYSSLELPQHAEFNTGDTIVTSGFSTVFPEGVPVGAIVEKTFRSKGENYNSVRVKLFTNFNALNEVLIVVNALKDEQLNVEKGGTE